MAQQETYPSPTAAQTGSGVSPYQQNHPDPNDDHLDLNAQLQNAQIQNHHSHDVHASMAGQAYNTANAQMSPRQQSYGYPPPASQMPYTGQIQGIAGPGPQTPEDPGRKKTKVTRACDECRRKKIKCDAESDAPDAAKCSNCQRTNAECQFSRPPQKRGPSKGYIKELSDRVAQLESTGRADFDSSLMSSLGSDRKRTWSTSEYGYEQTPGFSHPAGPKTFAPVTVPEAHMHLSSAKAEDLGIKLATPGGPETHPMARALNDVEEKNIQTFMSKVNPVIPLLGSRDGLNTNLSFCAPALRTAFYFAIGAVVGTLQASSAEQTRQQCADSVARSLRRGGPLFVDSPEGNWENRPYQANLVYFQTLLLCALYHQSSGPATPDPFDTFTCDQLLQQAHRMAEHLKLRYVTSPGNLGTGPEVNRVFSNARRAFWVFVCLDAWNSLSTRYRRSLPYFPVLTELTHHDRDLMKDSTFYDFVRRSNTAGTFGDFLHTVRSNGPTVADTGKLFLNICFEDNPLQSPTTGETPKTTFATLAQATLVLLATFLTAGNVKCPATAQTVEAALKISTMLATIELPTQGLPMTHHFVVPAVKALVRTADFSLRARASQGLRDILTAMRTNGILDGSSWYAPITYAIEARLNDEKSMRGLANAAAGEMEPDNGMSMDFLECSILWPALTTDGYLNGPLSQYGQV